MIIPKEQVTKAFKHGHTAFMPYFTLGYPDYETSLEIIQSCAEAGADLMELGMPFSDPLADGPTIQNSTQVALENGMDMEQCLQAVSDLRKRGITIPLMLMGYYNPVLNYGEQRFVEQAEASGANGFIIPDLPPEEGASFEIHCTNNQPRIYMENIGFLPIFFRVPTGIYFLQVFLCALQTIFWGKRTDGCDECFGILLGTHSFH